MTTETKNVHFEIMEADDGLITWKILFKGEDFTVDMNPVPIKGRLPCIRVEEALDEMNEFLRGLMDSWDKYSQIEVDVPFAESNKRVISIYNKPRKKARLFNVANEETPPLSFTQLKKGYMYHKPEDSTLIMLCPCGDCKAAFPLRLRPGYSDGGALHYDSEGPSIRGSIKPPECPNNYHFYIINGVMTDKETHKARFP